jgi:hypothetical protein
MKDACAKWRFLNGKATLLSAVHFFTQTKQQSTCLLLQQKTGAS